MVGKEQRNTLSETCKVTFVPDEIAVEVSPGTTILAALKEARIQVNSLCGGDGVCGRCGVIVREGKAAGGSTEFFTREEIRQGHILACEGRIEADLVVEVPSETRLGGLADRAGAEVPELTDVSHLARRGLALAPLVRKTYLELPPPSLEDNQSDLQRLEHALGRAIDTEGFQMGLKVTRRLPVVVREGDWKVTAVTSYRGPLTEIADVEPGDTTKRNMCVVVDIGTTTVVCHLVDLCDGQTLGRAGKYNSQAAYGADIIRRIIHASQSPQGQDGLRRAILNDINELIGELLTRYRLSPHDVTLISAAGNTAMIHLLLGLPAENVRKEPYVGAAYALPPMRAAEVGLHIHPRGLLYCLPCVAGFVGADIVAGIYASGMAAGEEVRMLIDIGTNGEIVIGNRDFLMCASASAGPAFEGAECSGGMHAAAGAIDHIKLLSPERVLSCSTIGSAPPVGICGTGYVDLIAEMLKVGVIDKTGRIHPDVAPSRVRQADSEEAEYVVVSGDQAGGGRDITITQGDVNNILRAKGAIYAAQRVLLDALDLGPDDVAEIMVAGAFGNFLNIENAVRIGLLPDVDADRMRFVGNTSLAGAKLAALSERCYREIFDVAARTTYFELSTAPTFMDQFVSACFFPHTDLELFPSVMAEMKAAGDS